MEIPKIPDNSLTEEIQELINLCVQLEPEYGKATASFDPPATEEEIAAWEKTNEISIPASYQDWLRFSNGSEILNGLAYFYGLNQIGAYSKYLPDDLVTIGELIGDGEYLCFSKETNRIVWADHGKLREYNDLKKVLNLIFDLI